MLSATKILFSPFFSCIFNIIWSIVDDIYIVTGKQSVNSMAYHKGGVVILTFQTFFTTSLFHRFHPERLGTGLVLR